MTPRPGLSLAARLRVALRVGLLALTVAVCVPLHFLCRLFTRHSPLPRICLGTAARIVGARVEVVGTPLKRDVFFLANHLSWLDIPAIAGASGTAFVAKAEVAKVPVIGWLCTLNHTVFVQREARMGVAGQINVVREALADNWAITVFPEGTTTDGQSLLPFKSSILQVLDPAPPGVLVQPIHVDYGAVAEDLCWIGEEGGIANVLRVLGRPGSFPLRIHFLEPFSPALHPGRKAIAAEARARIEASLLTSLGRPLRPFATEVAAIGYAPPEPVSRDD